MANEHPGNVPTTPAAGEPWAWARLYERAAVALQRRLVAVGALTPRTAATTVAAALPDQLGRWLLDRLGQLGWLRADARIPFDVLDGPECPADLRGGRREFVRLALFGPGGQGIPADAKHREAVFQQLCGDIMRETRDPASLQQAAARALNHPDVQRDSILHGMLRGFLAEREADFKWRQRDQHPADQYDSRLRQAFGRSAGDEPVFQVHFQTTFQRLRHEFDDQVAQFEEGASHAALARMRQMCQQHPEFAAAADVRECQEKHAKLVARCDVYRAQIEELAAQAVAAAQAGDQKAANWTLRRMSAIHHLRPRLLPTERFEALGEELARAADDHDHREAAYELSSRERAVAAEIKRLGEIVDRYHKGIHQFARGDARFRRIEEQYRQAVDEIRAHDTEWLADLMIELDALVDDLEDATGQAETQVSRFIESVRAALLRLRREVEVIRRERAEDCTRR